MFQSGLPDKRAAKKALRDAKTKAAQAEDKGDRVTARGHQALADWVQAKLRRGDYDN